MDKKERFNEAYAYLKYKGIIKTQNDVAEKMESSRSNVSSALSGKESVLTDNFIARFCAAFPEISYYWMLTGKGDMLSDYGMSVNERVWEILRMNHAPLTSLSEEYIELENLEKKLNEDKELEEYTIDKICELFNVNKEWLLTGKGNYDDKQTEESIKENTAQNTKPRLPITAAAGNLADYLGGILAHECEQIPVIRSFPDYDFTIMVKGNSMEPKYEGGDEIACKKVESIIEWGKSYVLATRDGAVLKRLYKDEDGVRCVSYNHEEYPDFIVRGDDILGVYRVVGLVRTGS